MMESEAIQHRNRTGRKTTAGQTGRTAGKTSAQHKESTARRKDGEQPLRRSSAGGTARKISSAGGTARKLSSDGRTAGRVSPEGSGQGAASGGPVRAAAKKHKGKSRRRRRNIIVLLVEAVVFVAALLILRQFIVPATQVGKVTLDDEKLVNRMNTGVAANDTLKGYRNIALFGVDSTKGELSRATRSDSIIIASINRDNGEIRLCSVYRDTFLNQGNDRYGKCNAAYARGGPEQAINMLNMNLDLAITDFITIGFGGLTDVINELGGIPLDIEESAVVHLNNYQSTMSQELGINYRPVSGGGVQTVDGLQATAYCRVRYISGNDFARAQHQREVIMATFEKAKGASAAELTEIANKVFKETYTSLDLSEITELLAGLGGYTIVDQTGFPRQDLLATGNIGKDGSCVVPTDLTENVAWLHDFLFASEAYTVSDEVRQYSAEVESRTAPYLR